MEKEEKEQLKIVLKTFGSCGNCGEPIYLEENEELVNDLISLIEKNYISKEEVKKELEELKRYVRKGNPKCNWCGKPATKQTSKGESNLKSGGLAVNDDWYCDDCYKKGLEIEKEAMYGN